VNVKIKLKNARTCNYCRAYGGEMCLLGYETEWVPLSEAKTWVKINTWEDGVVRIKPAEPCPKPRTIGEKVEIADQIDTLRNYRVDPDQEFMTEKQSKEHYLNLKDEL